MTEKTVIDVAWPLLIGLGTGLETYALVRRQSGLTLSSHVWDRRDQGHPTMRKAIIGAMVLYLGTHFIWGGPKSAS